MAPNNNQRPSLDGVRKLAKRQPEYRPDHELPAPEPTPLLEEHEPPLTDQKEQESLTPLTPKRNWKKWLLIGAGVLLAALIAVFIYAYSWYQGELAPVSSDTTKHVRVLIKSGSSPGLIADQLKSSGVIRNKLAFSIYTKLTGTENNLKAGAYNLQPSLSTPKIVEQLVAGKEVSFNVTFLPGDTLGNNRKKLIALGYSAAEVDAAFNAKYNRPLFATKPNNADLEGYFYGETIQFGTSATVESILNRFFEEYEAVITQNNLVDGFKKQGLTLFEGITLASIVQKETSNPDSQREVARVFLNRIKKGMNLGSDVTYQYVADKTGVPRDPGLQSPYNTRIHTGLPPGPIATPGKTALIAVANPGNNDYLFFLAGDDNKMHYGKTDAEHQQNIIRYCEKKCAIL